VTLRCLRRIRLVFFSRKSVVVYAILLTVGTLTWFADRWHGRHAWETEKTRLAAAGESLNFADLVPAAPPDDQNFCAIPELAPLRLLPESETSAGARGPSWKDDPILMWYGQDTELRTLKNGKTFRGKVGLPWVDADTSFAEVCAIFRKTGALPKEPLAADPAEELMLSAVQWEDLLQNVDAATLRPAAVFIPAPNETERIIHHRILPLVKSLLLHGQVCINRGDKQKALRDMRILNRISDAVESETRIISFLVSATIDRQTSEIVRAGMRRHTWTDAELSAFMENASESAVVTAWSRALAVQRSSTCRWLEFPSLIPNWMSSPGRSGMMLRSYWWLLLNHQNLAPEGPRLRLCARTSRFYSSLMEDVTRPLQPGETWQQRAKAQINEGMPTWFGESISEGTPQLVVRPVMHSRLFRVACLLELHYLKNGRYPASIEAALPADTHPFADLDGQPLRYHTDAEGKSFRLWSVAWDGKDDSNNTDPKTRHEDWLFSTAGKTP
jgi:hypothetical protein